MLSAPPSNRGIGKLLRDVAEDGAHLARQEVNLARIEFAQIARDIAKGTGFAVAAAMLGLLTVQMLVFGFALLMGDALFRGHYWIAAFVMTAILGGVEHLHCQRSEEHTSELQSRGHLVCRLLLEKKKI